jgi:hypothetical protein
MTTRLAIILALIIIGVAIWDHYWLDSAIYVFLGHRLLDAISWVTIWNKA